MKENLQFFNNTAIHLNVPQAGLIKNLWGIWHRNFMRKDGRLKRSRIQTQLKKFDSNFIQSLMGGVKTKLRAIADRGVLASYKK